MVQYLSIHKDVSDSACCVVRHTDAGPVRWARCEPGQVGNQAALSSAFVRFSKPASVCRVTQGGDKTPSSAVLYFCRKGRERGEIAMYRALYRKWRPQRFEDVVGQRAIVTALKTRSPQGAWAMRICLPACAAPARPPAPKFCKGGQLSAPGGWRPLWGVRDLQRHRQRQPAGRGGDGRSLQQRRG